MEAEDSAVENFEEHIGKNSAWGLLVAWLVQGLGGQAMESLLHSRSVGC